MCRCNRPAIKLIPFRWRWCRSTCFHQKHLLFLFSPFKFLFLTHTIVPNVALCVSLSKCISIHQGIQTILVTFNWCRNCSRTMHDKFINVRKKQRASRPTKWMEIKFIHEIFKESVHWNIREIFGTDQPLWMPNAQHVSYSFHNMHVIQGDSLTLDCTSFETVGQHLVWHSVSFISRIYLFYISICLYCYVSKLKFMSVSQCENKMINRFEYSNPSNNCCYSVWAHNVMHFCWPW